MAGMQIVPALHMSMMVGRKTRGLILGQDEVPQELTDKAFHTASVMFRSLYNPDSRALDTFMRSRWLVDAWSAMP